MTWDDTALRGRGILAIVVFRPLSGLEQECLSTLRLLFQVIRRKKYGRGLLLRDAQDGCWIGVRLWSSEETRRDAQEDPEVFRLWERLGQLCTVERVRSHLEKIEIE
jgi:hypothetical protein